MTVFLGCGFAAKYREGGGVFSVPLQWMLGLKRLRADAVWLEIFPGSGDEAADRRAIRSFQAQVRTCGLGQNYCLLYQPRARDAHELDEMRCFGMRSRELRDRLAGSTTLLNLSYSIHLPLLLRFERRIFCDLDPSEIFYWMTKLEMGQSTHHEFWTIGLNVGAQDCRLPSSTLKWRTFFPLVDTRSIRLQPKPAAAKFTTIGQWYWGGAVEVEGKYPDLSKKFAFEKYLELPSRVPEAEFELAMNIAADDPERARLKQLGWHVVDPHRVARTAHLYRCYVGSASAEFTAIKGVDVAWRTGWLSDRAAMFLAMGRPVITEDTGGGRHLPERSGFCFVRDLASASDAAHEVLAGGDSLAAACRATAVELFDSEKNLRKILGG
ncbi:MAG: hypothetical protein DLM73_10875 [Chthoniobacterales bacterium]|nr:MAG: hypothetical protein DLM73_10875 [Chthoniobacterales bacterium]PZR73621.1 MAG: hypothetical protein DLM52_10630 [Chthoniobacterales bacterium]